MRNFFTAALLAAGLTASAQEIHFEGTPFIFHNDMAIPEMKALTQYVAEDGTPMIKMESLNGAIYTAPAKDVKITTTTRSMASLSGRFQKDKLIKVFHDYENIDELECGDLIGIVEEHDWDLDGFLQSIYWLSQYMGVDMASMVKPYVQLNLAGYCWDQKIKIENVRFKAVDISYVGVDSQGNKTPFSGRFLFPYNINGNKKMTLSDIYIDNHPTVLKKGMEPSNEPSLFTSSPVVCKGKFVVMPDLIGFAASGGYSQQYVNKDINGADIAYCVVAAQQYINWIEETQPEYGFHMDKNAGVINVGSSQGATTALAGTYFMENCMDKSKFNINLKETHVQSGAYDMELCMNWFVNQDNIVYPVKIPAFFIGLAASRSDLLKSSTGEQYTIHDYFSPKASEFIYSEPQVIGTNPDGSWILGDPIVWGNLWQCIDMMAGSSTVPENCCKLAFPGGPNPAQGPSIHEMLAKDLFLGDGYDAKLNWECDKMKALKTYLDLNNLTDPNIWVPKSPITLTSTTLDDIIPIETSYKFVENMKPYNQNIKHDVITELPDIFPPQLNYGPHMTLCFVWYLSEITGFPIQLVNQILISQSEGDEAAVKALIEEAMAASK